MRTALAIGTFFILLIHGIVFYDQFFHHWERNQTAYFDQARVMAKSDAERAALADRKPRIEQIVVSNFGETRVDSCTTCHIASDDPRFTTYAEPLKTHPYSTAMGDVQKNGKWERRHKFSEFRVHRRHDGQGRTRAKYSHMRQYWPDHCCHVARKAQGLRPETEKQGIPANCAQCHTDPGFAGTAMVEKGRKLFFATNCYGCHRIEAVGRHIGRISRSRKEMEARLPGAHRRSAMILATSIMPKFNERR